MNIRNLPQSKSLVECFYAFKKLTDTYAFLSKDRDLSIFSKSQSSIVKIIDSIAELIKKTTFSISFPHVSFDNKLFFTEQSGQIYFRLKKIIMVRLQDENKINTSLSEFFRNYSNILKEALFHLWGSELGDLHAINLNYMDYYLDSLSVGLDCPCSYDILKQEALNGIFCYVASYPEKMIVNIVNPVFESIKKDDQGINQHADNNNMRFFNILKLLEMFRLTLIDKKENSLALIITKIIDNALEILRPLPIKKFEQDRAIGDSIKVGLDVIEKNIQYKNSNIFNTGTRAYP